MCEDQPTPTGFISSVLRFIDCQGESISYFGWQQLALPGSTLSMVLTAFMTLFIALIGYNLLLGQLVTIRTAVVALFKVGVVLTLATSWPAYRTLVYDVIVSGPSELSAELNGSSDARTSDAQLLLRLDAADNELARLAIVGSGNVGFASAGQQTIQYPPPPFVGFNAFALGSARILYLITAISSLGSVRILAALMLALGPLFAAFLLFDSTRSLFEGWVRVTAGTALAALAARLALNVQLSFIEPWIASALARREAEEILPTLPTELFVLITLFALIVLALMYGSVRVAWGFRFAPFATLIETGRHTIQSATVGRGLEDATTRNRIATYKEAQSGQNIGRSAEQRERIWSGRNDSGQRQMIPSALTNVTDRPKQAAFVPVGQSYRRSNSRRPAASAARRDLAP